MNRKILLIEPNYKNKYPPMGLMKLSTYYKMLGDEVTFFKGDLKDLVLDNCCDTLIKQLNANDSNVNWKSYKVDIKQFIRRGSKSILEDMLKLSNSSLILGVFEYYRKFFNKKMYFDEDNRIWDIVGISTLFTFHWDLTIDTINFAKKLCKVSGKVIIGGIMSTLINDKVEEATGIKPIVGLLNESRILDDNDIVVDSLPLDYSILHEIEYIYAANDAFFSYTTRGCVNRCKFCAVPNLEPDFVPYYPLLENIQEIRQKFGEKRDLLLLDNNILASPCFEKIIDEIKLSGFEAGARYVEPNQYQVAFSNLELGINDKAYINYIVDIYSTLIKKKTSSDKVSGEVLSLFNLLSTNKLLSKDTATKEGIIEVHNEVTPFFNNFYSARPKKRFVDFNQGLDARFVTEEKMKKLSEIAIRPVRIAFDNWKTKHIYEKAIRIAASNGHTNLSNYLLYNYDEKPVELYWRLKLNVDLCEELNVSIYSFPMKYHPIDDPQYFSNRDYLGKHWNRKFIRTIQAILNSTKGKIGKGKSFFEKAFGKNEDEFYELLYMPEAMIIYRVFFENNGQTHAWKEQFSALSKAQLDKVKQIVETNSFINYSTENLDEQSINVLEFYKIRREDAESEIG